MDKFESYEGLVKYLKGHTDLCMTLKYLKDKVDEEIGWYLKNYDKDLSSKERKDKKGEYQRMAQEDYLEEINFYLSESLPLTSMTIMGYRRKPYAWAIADAIKEYEACKEP